LERNNRTAWRISAIFLDFANNDSTLQYNRESDSYVKSTVGKK